MTMETLLSDKTRLSTTRNNLFLVLGRALLECSEIRAFIRLTTEAEKARLLELEQNIKEFNRLITHLTKRITSLNLAIASKQR